MGQDAEVLIVGAGPVGLTAALFLARYGVKTILVDRRDGPTNHPKARGITTRTMEIFRVLGVEEAMRAYELPPQARCFVWAKTFTGETLARITAESIAALDISPTHFTLVSQNWVEEALHEAVHNTPEIDLRLKTECTGFEDDGDGVTAQMREVEGQNRYAVRARYLIGADGASSMVRNALSINIIGQDDLGHFCNVYFRADLSPWVADRPAAGFFFAHPDLITRFLLSVDGRERWLLGVRYDPREGDSPQDFSAERCVEMIRETLGLAELNPEILGIDFWTMAALIASTFHKGSVLLAGDAAHRLPPTGGLGMNSGIQDAHNLCWKLAAVLRGQAGEELLDTFSVERSAVAKTNIDFSIVNARRFHAIGEAVVAGDDARALKHIKDQANHVNSVGLDLGVSYEKGALVSDGSEAPPFDPWHYMPSGHPGRRAPHFRVRRGEKQFSVLDLFGDEFVLLAGEAGGQWVDAARASRYEITAYRVGEDLEDVGDHWRDLYGIEASGAVLIRPDGHIAWRSKLESAEPRAQLEAPLERILHSGSLSTGCSAGVSTLDR